MSNLASLATATMGTLRDEDSDVLLESSDEEMAGEESDGDSEATIMSSSA